MKMISKDSNLFNGLDHGERFSSSGWPEDDVRNVRNAALNNPRHLDYKMYKVLIISDKIY